MSSIKLKTIYFDLGYMSQDWTVSRAKSFFSGWVGVWWENVEN